MYRERMRIIMQRKCESFGQFLSRERTREGETKLCFWCAPGFRNDPQIKFACAEIST